METAFLELIKRSKRYKYGDHPRIGRNVKDIERTEDEWNENKPPTVDVRRAIERPKNNKSLGPDSTIAELLRIKHEI